MKDFISDLGVIPSASSPMKIFCDNTGAIALVKESRFHKRTKHIKIRFNSIRDHVKGGRYRDLQNTYESECDIPVN